MRDAYEQCLRAAVSGTQARNEASDLVQTIFLHALERGVDVTAPERRAGLRAALRRRAAFEARLAIRRRKREAHWQDARAWKVSQRPWRFSPAFLASLQRHCARWLRWPPRLPYQALVGAHAR